MVNMIGYCEICHAIYETKQIQFSNTLKNATFKGGSIGTCEDDGGRILIPDGTFSVENDILKYSELNEPEEILKVLNVLQQFKYEKSLDNLKIELQKVSSESNSIIDWIFKFFKVNDSLELSINLVIALMTLGLGIAVDEAYDYLTLSDDETRQIQILNNQKSEKKREEKILQNQEKDKKRDKIIINQNQKILDKLDQQEKRQQYKERKSQVITKNKKKSKKKK